MIKQFLSGLMSVGFALPVSLPNVKRVTTRRLSISLIPLTFTSLLGVIPSAASNSVNSVQNLSSSVQDTLPQDGKMVFGNNKVIAEVNLDNGSVLRFIKFESNHIAVLEELPRGATSIRAVTELTKDAPLADVFYAFATPGTVPPPELQTHSITPQDRPQGWARSRIAASTLVAQITTGECNDNTFRNWFNQFSYNDRGTPNFRLNQVPRTSNFFRADDYRPGNGLSYDFYEYFVGNNQGSIWYNVDRYATRVAVCAIDGVAGNNPGGLAHPPISYQGYSNPHMGPVVRMMYRRPGESTWSLATSKDFAANEVGTVWDWHFYTGENWDWRTDIYWAGADDSFDIGHEVGDL